MSCVVGHMTYAKAQEIYRLDYRYSKKDVLSRYRELLKLNHPDNCSNSRLSVKDIKLARDVLLGTSSKCVVPIEDRRRLVTLDLEDLILIYKLKSFNGLTASDLIKNSSYIKFPVAINSDKQVVVSKFNRDDIYKMSLVLDKPETGDLEISVGDCKKNVKLVKDNIKLLFVLEFNIRVELSLTFRNGA